MNSVPWKEVAWFVGAGISDGKDCSVAGNSKGFGVDGEGGLGSVGAGMGDN